MPTPAAPAALDRARAATSQALELEALVEWIASAASTALGAQACRELLAPEAAARACERRALGGEALAACRAAAEPSLAGLQPLAPLAQAAHQRMLEGEELQVVALSLERVQELQRWRAREAAAYGQLAALVAGMPDLSAYAADVRAAIDERGGVRDEADPALAKLRQQLRQLTRQRQARLDEVADKLFAQGILRQRQAVQRDGRLLLAVRATSAGRARGVVHATSQSGDTAFVEPAAVLEISNRMVEARFRERRLEEEVLRRLSLALLRCESSLEVIDRHVASLDLAFAMARWAVAEGAVFAAADAASPGLRLDHARHPLLQRQLGREAVVPLDLSLGDHEDLLVVTGPNTGGKTLVLKTVGMLAWMANRGLPITAAEGSVVPPLTAVLADIGDAQSVADNLSTFSGHLARLQDLLALAAPGVLLLLDELGTGTDPEEGAALGQAVLEALLESGAWTIANTHLGALKLFSLGQARAENASMAFDPMSLAPKYQLMVGVPGASHAIEIAERLGLAAPLLARAEQLVQRGDRTEDLLADVGRVRREAEMMRVEAGDRERELAQRERQLAATESEVLARAQWREQEAEMAFREHYAALREWSEQLERQLSAQLPPPARQVLTARLEALRQLLDSDPLNRRWQQFIRSLRKGERVHAAKLGAVVNVSKVDRKRERVKVQYEGMEVELTFHDLSWVRPPELD